MRKIVHRSILGIAAAAALALPVALPQALPDATAASQNVREGERGSEVKAVQYLLNAQGAGLEVDGIFGAGTTAAVKKFQSDNGLTADGIVGPDTVKKLAPLTKRGSQGDPVRAVQQAVGSDVDGVFGAGTEQAVKKFQGSHGLNADGVVGANTWNAILGLGSSGGDNGSDGGGSDDQNTGETDRTNPAWRQQTVMAKLVERGYTPEQAAGMVGNMITESGVEPTQHERGYPFPSDRGWGLVQWTHSRNHEIVAKVKSELGAKYYTNDADSLSEKEWMTLLDFQVDYVVHELETSHKSVGEGIKNADTAAEASDVFLYKFERPADPDATRAKRVQQAETVLKTYRAGGVDAL